MKQSITLLLAFSDCKFSDAKTFDEIPVESPPMEGAKYSWVSRLLLFIYYVKAA